MKKKLILVILGYLALLSLVWVLLDQFENKIYLSRKKRVKIDRKIASHAKKGAIEDKKDIERKKMGKEIRKKLMSQNKSDFFRESFSLEDRWIISDSYGGKILSPEEKEDIKKEVIIRNIVIKELPLPVGQSIDLLILDKKTNRVGIFTREVVVISKLSPDMLMLEDEQGIKLLKSLPRTGVYIFKLLGETKQFEESLEMIRDSFEEEIEIDLDIKLAPLSVN